MGRVTKTERKKEMGKSKPKGMTLNNAVLTKWRELMGYSEREAALQLGCSREAWSGWEKGDRKIPKYIGLALAALALGMKPYGSEQPSPYKEED